MEYLSSDQDYEDSLSADTFSEEVCAAYDVIANSWVQAKDFEVSVFFVFNASSYVLHHIYEM